ncbi:Disease resistance protein RPM1 [Linum grandiflorum]
MAFLVNEVTMYGQNLEEMKQELMSMRSFLEDAQDNPNAINSKSKQTQVSQVRDLVYDIEDIIDRFMYHRNKWRGQHTFIWYVKRTVGFPKYFWERRQIATTLQQLNAMIKAIPERHQRYPVDAQESTKSTTGAVFKAESALFLSEEDLVGIENPKQVLMGLLTNGDSKRTTISVVGMGGSDGHKGSRVIITTRMDDIASYSSSQVGSHVYHVKPLNKDKAWQLFCMRAFPSKSCNKCPPELQVIANRFMEKCEGLPLAIGLLATKTSSIRAWTTVFKNLQWELSNNQMLQPIKSILLLSYNDLPYRLRYCFLYFSLLPEDYMGSLRHLLSGHDLRFGKLPMKGIKLSTYSDISSLENLQTLRFVEASGVLMKQLKKMVQLVQLGITNLEGHAQMEDLCSSLQGMLLLRWLVVMASNEDELLQMDSLNVYTAPPLQLLEYLILGGKLKSLPDWIKSLHSLTTIRLIWSKLPVEEDPVVHLQGMNNLRNAWFNNAYISRERVELYFRVQQPEGAGLV